MIPTLFPTTIRQYSWKVQHLVSSVPRCYRRLLKEEGLLHTLINMALSQMFILDVSLHEFQNNLTFKKKKSTVGFLTLNIRFFFFVLSEIQYDFISFIKSLHFFIYIFVTDLIQVKIGSRSRQMWKSVKTLWVFYGISSNAATID